jgi:hypothetical protein
MIRIIGNALHRDMCGTDVPCLGFCNWKHVAGIFIINANVAYHFLYNVTISSLDRQQLEKENRNVTMSTTSDTRLSVIIII